MKKITLGLFLLLVQSHLVAARAVLLDFHLFGMLALIPCSDVVFFLAFRTSERNVFSWHDHTS